jgi:hypothetical protein
MPENNHKKTHVVRKHYTMFLRRPVRASILVFHEYYTNDIYQEEWPAGQTKARKSIRISFRNNLRGQGAQTHTSLSVLAFWLACSGGTARRAGCTFGTDDLHVLFRSGLWFVRIWL